MWDLPGPGLEPVSPALAGGFLTTAPPGKPWLLYFLNYFFIFYFNNIFLLFILITYFISFLSFFIFSFLPFLLSHVADRVLLLQPGVRPDPLRRESSVQDIGPTETSRAHIISISGESSPRHLHINAKPQIHSMTSKLHCWTPHAKQIARQEHNPSH